MCRLDWVVLAALLLIAAGAGAQTAKPDAADEAAAAMERAKRQAAGPMRVILEASKSRRKGTDPDPPVAAEAINVRPVASRQPAGAGLAAAAQAPSTTAATASSPAPAPTPSPVADNTRPPDSGVVTQIYLSSEALQNKVVASPVAGLQASGSVSTTTVPLPGTMPLALSALAPSTGAERLKILQRVDPDLSQRVLEDLGRNTVVMAELSLQRDGRVSAVAFKGFVPRPLQRPLQAALQQWVFEPQTAERVYRIELLFNAEN